jgi:cell division protein FtsW (lipid II flippase)
VSLKGFHVLLISLSCLLTAAFGGWSIAAWRTGGGAGSLLLAVASFALAAGLAVYVVWFARQIRTRDEEERRRRGSIHPLAASGLVWFFASTRPALACSTCYGAAEGSMIDAARLGVWLLFGLVLAVQAAFVLFFLHLRRRARHPRRVTPRLAAR